MDSNERRAPRRGGNIWWTGVLVAGLGLGCGGESSPAEQAGGSGPGASGASGQGGDTGGGDGGSGGSGGSSASGAGAGGAGNSGVAGSESGGGAGCPPAECDPFKTPPGEQAAPPPAKDSASVPDGATVLRHGLSAIRMGEKNAAGDDDLEAWKELGFDIDGWATTPQQGFHCKPRVNGKAADIRVDGKGGIDNSFGKNIVNPILKGLFEDLTGQATMSVQSGAATTVLELGLIGEKADYKGLLGGSLPTEGERDEQGKFIKPPATDWSKYTWHPFQDAVEGDGTPVVKLPGAYVSDQVWVSGEPSVLRIQLAFEAGLVVPIQVYQARVKVDLADRNHGVTGIVGGVLATQELVDTFKKLAGFINTQFCGSSPILDGLTLQVERASDILQDGTQDPGKECDGISIGLGFESRTTRVGETVTQQPPPDPCAP